MFYSTIKRLPLKCGGNVSIQASEGHYCNPRNNEGPYDEWEMMPKNCPHEAMAVIADYFDGDIAAYVPTKVVDAFVKACGGAAGMLLHPFALPVQSETRCLSPDVRTRLSAWR